MNKILALVALVVVLLAGCAPAASSPSASVPNNPDAKATKAIVEKYMAAAEATTFNAKALVPLYADSVTLVDYGFPLTTGDRPLTKADISSWYTDEGAPPQRKAHFQSYLVTADGRFAVIQAVLTFVSSLTNKPVSAPATGVLEFANGQIVNETWYYNADLVH